jgi:PPK2 family polyphosphate:nucleotide phosphotransferase
VAPYQEEDPESPEGERLGEGQNGQMPMPLSDRLRLRPGPVDLGDYDPDATPGFSGGKTKGQKAIEKLGVPLSDLQEKLYAESRGGGERRILLVLQGMDTSGKGGIIKHCAGLLDPQGVSLTSFKAPTEEERRHDFLWRIEPHAPTAGMVGIFDRSHYEDVLIARVRSLAPTSEIDRRYGAINDFEHRLATASSTTVVKCFLHISRDTQRERLLARLTDPTKHWKFNPGDVDERALWPDYQRAYEIALERCSTDTAPWYVVPSDHKWYRNWAITTLLTEHLEALDPQWPKGDFDIGEQIARVLAT